MPPSESLDGVSTAPPVLKHRPEVDGLRAVAVIPVILFHAGFAAFPGGFVGVDVFFVISGYLITNIIYSEISNGGFSIGRFYERRVRRILPALLLVLIVSAVLAWRWMLPLADEAFSKSLVAVNLFVSNILFWRETGYFDQGNQLKPLLHTWSLAVEEQFYLFFPPLLLLVTRLRGRAVVGVVAGLTMASLLLAEWASYRSASFYLLPTRAWELGVGAVIALAALDRRRWPRVVSELCSIIGLMMILFAIFTYQGSANFAGFEAIPPVLGTAFIICFAKPNTFCGRVLSLRPVVAIGLISYSAYLWHQVIFAFARLRSLEHLGTAAYLGLSGLSLVLAYLSLRFVETPFRDRRLTTRRQVLSWSAAVAATLIVVGVLGVVTHGLPQRMDPAIVAVADMPQTQSFVSWACGPEPGTLSVKHCVHGDFDRRIVVWGDSEAMALAPGLADVMAAQRVSVTSLTRLACTPVLGWNLGDEGCERFRRNSFDYLTEASGRDDVVVIHGRWLNLLGERTSDDGEGGEPRDSQGSWVPRLSGFAGRNPKDPGFVERVHRLVDATIRPLLESGRRVVLVYDVPDMGWDVPSYRARSMLFGEDKPDVTVDYDVVRAFQSVGDEFLDALGEHPNLLRVYPDRALCDREVSGRCVGEFGGQVLYLDSHHLSRAGATLVGQEIQRAMAARGW